MEFGVGGVSLVLACRGLFIDAADARAFACGLQAIHSSNTHSSACNPWSDTGSCTAVHMSTALCNNELSHWLVD
jgi:hypothetical protein